MLATTNHESAIQVNVLSVPGLLPLVLFSQGHSTRPDASWLLEERSPYQSYPVLLLSSRGSPLDDPHRVLPLRTSPKLYPDHAAGGRPTCKQILRIGNHHGSDFG